MFDFSDVVAQVFGWRTLVAVCLAICAIKVCSFIYSWVWPIVAVILLVLKPLQPIAVMLVSWAIDCIVGEEVEEIPPTIVEDPLAVIMQWGAPWCLVSLQAAWIHGPWMFRLVKAIIWMFIRAGESVLITLRLMKRNTKEHFVGLANDSKEPKTQEQLGTKLQLEATVKGSDLESVPEMPACQFLVYGNMRQGDDPQVVGSGFRVDNRLVTAHHVIDQLKEIWLATKNHMVPVNKESFQDMEFDVASTMLTPDLAKLGLKKPTLCSPGTEPFSAQFVSIYARKPHQRTMGMLKPNKMNFYVTYMGTTLPGFSGAPYVSKNRVYGMHIGANGDNIGLDGTYVEQLVSSKNESWDGWSAKDHKFQAFKVSNGNFLRTPTGYRKISEETYDKYYALGQDLKDQGISLWADEPYEGESLPVGMIQHDNSDSGNASRAGFNKKTARASASTRPGPSQISVDAELLKRALAVFGTKPPVVMNQSRPKATPILKECISLGQKKPGETMVSPQLTAAQSIEASPNTSQSMSVKEAKDALRQVQKQRQQLLKLLKNSGRQGTDVVIEMDQAQVEASRVVEQLSKVVSETSTPNPPPVYVPFRNVELA